MRASYPISLFSKPPQKDSGPSAFGVSIVLHGVLLALLLITVKRARVVPLRMPNRKYDVRLMDMRKMEASLHWYPRPTARSAHAAARSISAGGRRGQAPKVRLERVSRNFETPRPAPQTIIQPQVPPEQRTLPNIPIPHAMVWTEGAVTKPKIVTPPPKPPSDIHVKPVLTPPNHELNLSSMPLTSTPFVTEALMPAPGTTVPVQVNGAQPGAQLPVTASKAKAVLSAARVISLSDTKLQDGTAALPVINEVAQADSSGSPLLGGLGRQFSSGNDKSDSRENGSGAGHGAGQSGNHAGGVTVDTGTGLQTTATPDAGFTIDTGSGSPNQGETAPQHIQLPKGGQYGMVVVGASPEEDYPETADLWDGRLVYTVYLQTNTAQNWILQYSLPKVANDPPSDGALSAPWPYDMMRPSLKYQDVILVHGFVNEEGKFEKLSIAFPPGLAEAPLLLRTLKQWVFRPAALNGQTTRVEVLLIIPGVEQD
ncbi:MAG: hypothetical protein WBD10_11985 [Acidobacteriaceae bacterium]